MTAAGTNSARRRALSTFIELARGFDRVNTAVHAHLRDADLTASQFGVLEALYHVGPLTQQDLCRKLLKTSGNLTMVIDNLEKRELVVRLRSPDDRRANNIELTTAGRKLIERIFPQHAAGIEAAFSGLTAAEQDQLRRLCKKLQQMA